MLKWSCGRRTAEPREHLTCFTLPTTHLLHARNLTDSRRVVSNSKHPKNLSPNRLYMAGCQKKRSIKLFWKLSIVRNSKPGKFSKITVYQRHFLTFSPTFDLGFTLKGWGVMGLGFLIEKSNRSASSGVTTAFFWIMLFYASRNIFCNTSVEGCICAFNDVDVPHIPPRVVVRRARLMRATTRLLTTMVSKEKPLSR